MRYVKILALVLFFFVGMVFFVQNTEFLTKSIPLKFSVFSLHWSSSPIPIYLYILVAFVLGAVISMLFFAWDRFRQSKEIKRCRQQIASMQEELNSLRPKSVPEETSTSEFNESQVPQPMP